MHSIDASVVIDAPVALCYQTWMDFEKFPTFMTRVVSVSRTDANGMLSTQTRPIRHAEDPQKDVEGVVVTELTREVEAHGNNVWHWEIKGPLGQLFKWTGGIVMNEPNKAISWATLPEDQLPNTGTVNFLKSPTSTASHERTLMTVTMSFSAPGGAIGEFLADIVHYGDNLLSEALDDFKRHVETLRTEQLLEQG